MLYSVMLLIHSTILPDGSNSDEASMQSYNGDTLTTYIMNRYWHLFFNLRASYGDKH